MGFTDKLSGGGKVIKKIIIIIGFLVFALGTPIFANDVRITQQLLTKLGYNPGPIDGSYGDKTKRALENFYAAQNKKFDGELSSNEINALETVFAKKNNSSNKPPFEGTAYVDKDIIRKNDPSDFISLEYVGLVKEESFDRRVDTLVSQDMFVFNVKYKHKKGTRVIVNKEFGNVKNAQRQAERYAFVVGQMPLVLLRDVDTITIHKGKKPFGGGNRDILVHTGSGADFRRDGFLEEVIFHEACHTSLDADAYENPAWEKARLSDNNFISSYALDYPNGEDVAESCLMYFASKYRPDRISNGIKNLILKTIPSRINYFDKYANPVAKPVFNKAIPEGMSAVDVMSNYIESIGGKGKLNTINTLITKAGVTIPGAPFVPEATSKQMMPNKVSFEMKADMGGQTMSLMKRNFSGEKGYMEQQGQKTMMTEEELDEAKNVQGIFDELYYTKDEIELVSINSIDGDDVYKVKVVKNNKTTYRYYSIASGFLISMEEEDENKNISSTKFGDYRDVDGIMVPYFMLVNAGGQELEFNTTEVLFNTPLKDSDFY